MSTEFITVRNEQKWNKIIHSMYEYDFYHLAFYHKLEKSEFSQPILFHFYTSTTEFAFPFIIRNIMNTSYNDITSVYGYTGILCNYKEPIRKDILDFQKELKRYFDTHKIVSVFVRLHPLFNNQSLILSSSMGKLENINTTIGIDLNLADAEQKKHYTRSLKNHINRLINKGVYVIKAFDKSTIDAFIKIYHGNMNRVNASKFYYFPPDYFYTILAETDACILLAIYKDKPISGSLCTFTNGIMQAHLNATDSNFLYLSPLKLVLEQARIEGIKRGMNYLHLGGGRNGTNDSLFTFKSRFSNKRFLFKVWKYIHNKKIYNDLVCERIKETCVCSTFFPSYRSK